MTRMLTYGAAAIGGAFALFIVYKSRFSTSSDMIVRIRALTSSWMVYLSGTSSTLTKLDLVEKIAPNVIRVLGLNPGRMTLQGTNTYIIGTGKGRILIDTGDGSQQYMELLLATLRANQIESITDVLLTHGHFDHVGGCWALQQAFPAIRIWKLLTYKSINKCECECSSHVSNSFCQEKFHMHDLHTHCVSGNAIKVDGASIRVLKTPGHTNDHVCFILEDAANGKAIFTGDCILGEGTCTFQDLSEYMQSLQSLKDEQPTKLYPGHGPVLDKAADTIDMYISHRKKREDEILQLLSSSVEISVPDIVTKLYPNLAFALTFPAKRNVKLHLQKLITERHVTENANGTYSLIQ